MLKFTPLRQLVSTISIKKNPLYYLKLLKMDPYNKLLMFKLYNRQLTLYKYNRLLIQYLHNFQIKAIYISGYRNEITDFISRLQWCIFRQLAPCADCHPHPVPTLISEPLNGHINRLIDASLSNTTKIA